LSYFAKPNFIVYDEWFDDDFKKNKIDVKNRKIKTITNIHDFFYKKSNYKIGASENNFQLGIKINKKEIINNDFCESKTEKNNSISNKKFSFFEKLSKSKLKFNLTKKLIYSLSIFGFILFFGFQIFFISQSKKNKSNVLIRLFSLEQIF
jgi:hypothetical protein